MEGKAVFSAISQAGPESQRNQDAWIANSDLHLFAVSDGIGAAGAGELASRMAVEEVAVAIAELWPEELESDASGALVPEAVVGDAIGRVNQALRHEAARLALSHMGATLALTWLVKGGAVIATLGDSRVYLHRAGELTQMHKDQTVAQKLVDEGMMDALEDKLHPLRFQLTEVLGMKETVAPEVDWVGLAAGDRVLLCTNGLHAFVQDRRIEAILNWGLTVALTAKELMLAAEAAGSKENKTVLLIHVD